MSPRSILKRSTTTAATSNHAVHFPPSPSLCRTFAAHPPTIYDRTPIVVSKNSCALPERNGRTYVLDSDYSRTMPRATRPAPSIPQHHRTDLPQLVPDLSSESDDSSDSFTPSPSQPQPQHIYAYGAHGLPTKYDSSSAYDYSPSSSPSTGGGIDAMAFLPYPPSPPAHYPAGEEQSKPRTRRSESSSRRRGDGASDPDRISKPSRREQYLQTQYAGFMARDDGCLGGF